MSVSFFNLPFSDSVFFLFFFFCPTILCPGGRVSDFSRSASSLRIVPFCQRYFEDPSPCLSVGSHDSWDIYLGTDLVLLSVSGG